jgi:Zn ribbon nucleic-acid-binding protein
MGHTGSMLRRPAHVTRRRVAAHACPACRRLWALRGVRADDGSWLISCSSCGWSDLRTPGGERRGTVPAQHPGTGTGASDRTPVPAADPSAGRAFGSGGQWSHGVYLYATDDALLTVLEEYLLTGWSQGAVGLVIATPEHRAALRARLTEHGRDGCHGDGQLVELDAATTLDQFMRDGVPDAGRFHRTVGSLVRDHAADRPLRGFGEMVDVLWAAGNAVGALELERLWTGLQQQVPFTLLCAYATAHVDPEDRGLVTDAHEHQLT